MLIRNADIWRHGAGDVRIVDSMITEVGRLTTREGEQAIDARGGALLPGLHDHHIHLCALAVRSASVQCGPPKVNVEDELALTLSQPGAGWLRGIGYHESVAGMLTATMLDRWVPERPVRIQHRSGRMWFLNSCALDILLARTEPPPGLERATGRLFDDDEWLSSALGSAPPDFAQIGAGLAGFGVTGLTDMTPSNGAKIAGHFITQSKSGRLSQKVVLAGTLALAEADTHKSVALGPAKLHLHEHALPDFAEAVAFVSAAHEQARGVAVHCTTETELVFALAAIAEADARLEDRIEHAGIASDALIGQIAELGLTVVSQPHFIAERGDQYSQAVAPRDLASLYRLRAFTEAGVTLAAGSDAPFGQPDPWAAMAAAVSRTTRSGRVLGSEEALDPEQALALFFADPHDLRRQRTIAAGVTADLCLLDRPWSDARRRLSAGDVRATIVDGGLIHDRIDQAPGERGLRVDSAA